MQYQLSNRIKVTDRFEHFPVLPTDSQIEQLYDGEMGELILESISLNDIDTTFHMDMLVPEALILEAIKTNTNRIENTMKAFVRAFNQQAGGTGFNASNVSLSKPRKSGAISVVTAKMMISDGQSISVVFHNPDNTPDKINPGDTLVAFRFMLNGRDVTHLVAPSGGKDISLKQATMVLVNVVEKNFSKFQENQAKNAELKAQIETNDKKAEQVQEETALLSDQVDSVNAKIDEAQMSLDNLQRRIDEQNDYQEDLRQEIESLKLMNSQTASYWYGLRTRPFDIASQPSGHTAYINPNQAKTRFPEADSRSIKYGVVGYQSSLSDNDIEHYNMSDLNRAQSASVSELSAIGHKAISDAIDNWMSGKNLTTLDQNSINTLLQVYDLKEGDSLRKLQAIFSEQLREQEAFKARKENPELYKQWTDALQDLDRSMLEDELLKRKEAKQELVQDFDKELEQLSGLKDVLNAGKVSLKAAKQRFVQIVSQLPGALKKEAGDVQLANRKDRYMVYLDSFSERLKEYDPQAPSVSTEQGVIDFNEMTYDSMDEHNVFGKTLAQVAKTNPEAVIRYLEDGSEWMSNYSPELLKAAADKAKEHYLPPQPEPEKEPDPNIGREWNSMDGHAKVTELWEEGYVVKYENKEAHEVVSPGDLEEVIRRDEANWESAQTPEPENVPEQEVVSPSNEKETLFVDQLRAIRDGENTDIDNGIEVMEAAYEFFSENDLIDQHMDLLEAASDVHTNLMDKEAA